MDEYFSKCNHVIMGYGDAPGTMEMYNRNPGPQTDMGQAQGAELYNREMSARQLYSEPAVTPAGPTFVPDGTNRIPYWYNSNGAPSVKYTVPTEDKENFRRKEAIRTAINEQGRQPGGAAPTVVRTDPITDGEVAYLKSMEEQAELADFDRYVQTLIDPRKPGNMKFLMEIYPQFVERRIQQAHTDYSYAIRKQMIDQWGVNTFDDLHFLYLMDQGKVDGPILTTNRRAGNAYSAGILSPFAYSRERLKGIRLPFASAKFGENAGTNPANWTQNDKNMPLAANRSRTQMASDMYARPSDTFNQGATRTTENMRAGIQSVFGGGDGSAEGVRT